MEPAIAVTHVSVLDRGRELTGVVQSSESWFAAAVRISSSLHAIPAPLDLSGEVKRFVLEHDVVVAVRAMTRGDLPDVVRWRQSEHVARWWVGEGEPSPALVEATYAPRIDGLTPTRMWVAEINGRSVGFLQDYRIRDYPEYALLGPDPEAIGVDYAIGDPAWVGRGLGLHVLWAWMLRAHHRFPEATSFFAAPDHRNAASLRVLAKAGFDQGVWFDEPQQDGSIVTVIGCTLDVGKVLD